MKVTVTEQSPSDRTLEVAIDTSRVESAFQKAFKKNLKHLALPGFRKGKVPSSMAQKYITDAGLVRDVVEDLVPKTFEEATEQEGLQPISQPEWDLIQSERGKELIYKASFQVAPVLEIKGYDGLEITQAREEITEEIIGETLDRMRSQHAEFVTLEEPKELAEGDFAVVDYSSSQNGEEIEGGSVSNYLMELNPEAYIPGFVDNLVGLKAGSEKSFDITFPEDYNNSDLAGETVTFAFKIHDLKEKRLPELNDEFAKSHSDKETVAELRQAIEEQLKEGVEHQAKSEATLQIIQTLLEQVGEDVLPAPLKQHHTQMAVRARMMEFAQRGLGLEQVLAARGISQDQWLQEMMGLGLFEARQEVLYRSIAKAEDISVTEEQLDEIIAAEAPAQKMKPKQLKRRLQQNGGLEQVRFNILRERVQKVLLEKADVRFVAPSEIAAAEEAEENKPKKAKSSKSKAKSKKSTKTEKAVSKEAAESPTEASEEKEAPKPKAKPKAASKSKKKSKAKANAE